MTKIAKLALLAAPAAMIGYGVARYLGRLDGTYGPGFDWQLAHFLGLAGFILFVPLVLGLRTLLPTGPAREVVIGATVLGLVACVVQFTVDIVQGFAATNREELRTLQHELAEVPGEQVPGAHEGPSGDSENGDVPAVEGSALRDPPLRAGGRRPA